MATFGLEAIAWCRSERLKPVFVYPPASACFDGVFPEDFFRAYVLDFVRAVAPDVPFFDYRSTPELRTDRNFADALFLNRTGCAVLTGLTVRDVRMAFAVSPSVGAARLTNVASIPVLVDAAEIGYVGSIDPSGGNADWDWGEVLWSEMRLTYADTYPFRRFLRFDLEHGTSNNHAESSSSGQIFGYVLRPTKTGGDKR